MNVNKTSVIIDSGDRLNYPTASSADFAIRVEGLYNKNYRNCQLEYVKIPNTIYTINSNNNSLGWTSSITGYVNSSFTQGYYSASDLASHVGTTLQADKYSGDGNFSASYSSLTGKLTISNSSTVFSLDFQNPATTSAELLGFNVGMTGATGATSYVSSNVLELQPVRTISIETNLPLGNSEYNSNGKNLNILTTLPVDASSGNYLTRVYDSLKVHKLDGDIPNILRFRLFDQDGRILSLNGANWNMGINFF